MGRPAAERLAALRRRSDDLPDIGAFVAEHYDRLLGLTRLICRDASDAGDALQIGLDKVRDRLAGGAQPVATDEDIHTMIDRLLHEEAGAVAPVAHADAPLAFQDQRLGLGTLQDRQVGSPTRRLEVLRGGAVAQR